MQSRPPVVDQPVPGDFAPLSMLSKFLHSSHRERATSY